MLATAAEATTFAFGLLTVVVAALVAQVFNADRDLRTSGYFGYNAMLAGAGIGHLYAGSWRALPVAVLAAVASVLFTGAARAWLTRTLLLPVLSLPFLAVFGLLTRAGPELGLASPQSGAAVLSSPASITTFLSEYARCLGSVLFVPSVRAGALIGIALLVYSRIASLLALAAFGLLFAANFLLPAPLSHPVFTTVAANAMLLSIAIGGVWFVFSKWSLLWASVGTLLCLLVTAGVSQPLAALGLPTLFVPFNLLLLAVLLGARERGADRNPKSVDFAPGSPEENLRYLLNQRVRFPLTYGIRFHLPFRGRWTCSQAVDGEYTHQGPWRHAFDFHVVGEDGELFDGDPGKLAHYHCYRLPVLAAAPGWVVKIEDAIQDNPVGTMNLVHNWGNFVMLQHAPGVYSLVAHLCPGTVKVKEGQQVVQGDVLGLCGNSGRSPTPHIHFHLQKAPFLGAETMDTSFSDVVLAAEIGERLEICHVPRKGDMCRNLEASAELSARICPKPGDVWHMRSNGREETVEIDLDLLGQIRLQSSESTRVLCTRTHDLYLVHDPVGRAGSVLTMLRAALPRIPLEDGISAVWKDYAPALGTRAPSLVGGLASFLVPRAGLAMSYTAHKEGNSLIVDGVSSRRDRRGNPFLCTQIVFDDSSAPVAILVRHKGREERALRASNGVAHPVGPAPVVGEIAAPADLGQVAVPSEAHRQIN